MRRLLLVLIIITTLIGVGSLEVDHKVAQLRNHERELNREWLSHYPTPPSHVRAVANPSVSP